MNNITPLTTIDDYDTAFLNFTNINNERRNEFTNIFINTFFDNIYSNLYENNDENQVINTSLYETNPNKRVITEKAKRSLKKMKYRDVTNKEENVVCPIIQDEFKDDDNIIQLPCEHCFFENAILNWLTSEKAECPVCRFSFESIEIKKAGQKAESETDLELGGIGSAELYDTLFQEFFIVPNQDLVNQDYISEHENDDEDDNDNIINL